MSDLRPSFLSEKSTWNAYDNEDLLIQSLVSYVSSLIEKSIEKYSYANIAVSGGKTPKNFFRTLSKVDLDWGKVNISLVDDRFLSPNDSQTNEFLVRENLLINNAKKANFFPLLQKNSNIYECCDYLNKNYIKNFKTSFHVVILGLGIDGHTGSIFPCSKEIRLALDDNTKKTYIAVHPTSVEFSRITLTKKYILKSKNIIIHISGNKKIQTLRKAIKLEKAEEMPIISFLTRENQIYWCP